MPRYQDIEIVDIDDPSPSVSGLDSTIRRAKTLRRSTSLGGKSRRIPITSRPLRRQLSRKVTTTSRTNQKEIECFDIDDDDDEDDYNKTDDSDPESEDDITVLEEDDPLEDESIGEELTDGFCDLCGLHLPSQSEIEKHQLEVHKTSSCKWCDLRVPASELKVHLLTSCSKFVKLRGTHCSVHKRIEREEDLEQEEYKNCRPLSCDTCLQRFELGSLHQKEDSGHLFLCPGCLHGRVDPSKKVTDIHPQHSKHLVREILADLVSCVLTKDPVSSPSCSNIPMDSPSEDIEIITDKIDEGADTDTRTREEDPVRAVSRDVRRVARKSTRPPMNPQRPAEKETEEEPSKRKLDQSDETNAQRKVARKSTRPPTCPQREKDPEVVELEDDDEDIVELPTESHDDGVMSLLLDSPRHDQEDNQQLEEIVLS